MDEDEARLPTAPSIHALDELAELRRMRLKFSARYGFEPENLSHWNPKAQFREALERAIAPFSRSGYVTDYTYTYDLTRHAEVLSALREPAERSCLFTPSGTTSIANVLAYLKNTGTMRLAAVRPCYFALEEFTRFCGMELTTFAVYRATDGRYHLPQHDEIIRSGCQAVWLTTPVYGTSVYYDVDEVTSWVDRITQSGITIILDESLAHSRRSIIGTTRDASSLLCIYVPHKALCLNGVRFSAVTFPSYLADNFEQWSDIFSGGLPSDSVAAIEHFCSPRFEMDTAVARQLQGAVFEQVQRLVSAIDGVETDKLADGHFRHVYVPSLEATWERDLAFVEKIIFRAGASFIPAYRFGHPDSSGFCFRVNLLRLDQAALGGLYRILTELSAARCAGPA